MIIEKETLAWQRFVGDKLISPDDPTVWCIEDDTELANKICGLGLDWTPITDSDGNLIDCEPKISRFVNKKIEEFRTFRRIQFQMFDIYKSNVEYGIISETEDVKQDIINWYNHMLNFPTLITEETYEVIIFPETPEVILQYQNF